MKRIIVLFTLGAALGAAGCARSHDDVILVAVDSFRADRVNVAFGPGHLTPAIDSLAAHGVLFTEARTPSPTLGPAAKTILGADAGGLASAMQSAGYFTIGAVSSAALGKGSGREAGFDAFDDSMGIYTAVDPSYATVEDALSGKERRAGDTVDAALRMAARAPRGKPLFLFVQLADPEQPYDPPLPFASDHSNFEYDGEIAYVDSEVGRLVREIARRRGHPPFVAVAGLFGEGLGDHNEATHGFFLYDTTIRVPLVFSGRGVPRGSRQAVPVSLSDATATLASLAGAHLTGGQGRDMRPALKGRPIAGVPIFSSTMFPKETYGWSALAAVVEGGWKLIRAPQPELYRLADDPRELNNLAAEQPETVQRLGNSLEIAGFTKAFLFTNDAGDTLPDPKSKIADWNRVQQARFFLRQGRIYEDSSAFANALVQYDRADSIAPELPEVHAQRGSALLHLDRDREARDEFRQALALDDGFAPAWSGLGLVEERAGRLPAARADFERSVDEANGSSSVLLAAMSFALRHSDLGGAVAAGEKLVAAHPNDLTSLNDLATLYLQSGDVERSLSTCRRALLLKADDPITQYNLGRAYVANGHYADAARAFQRYVTLWPNAPNAAAVRDGIEELKKRAEKDTTAGG